MKYPGMLGKRRPYRALPSMLADDVEQNAYIISEFAERFKIITMLFDHYGCTRGDLFGLVWALANDHVPAMSRRAKAGHPQKWNPYLRAELRIAVDGMTDRSPDRSMSLNSALTNLAKQPPWKKLVAKSDTAKKRADLLLMQYKKAPLALVEVIRQNPDWGKPNPEFDQADDVMARTIRLLTRESNRRID